MPSSVEIVAEVGGLRRNSSTGIARLVRCEHDLADVDAGFQVRVGVGRLLEWIGRRDDGLDPARLDQGPHIFANRLDHAGLLVCRARSQRGRDHCCAFAEQRGEVEFGGGPADDRDGNTFWARVAPETIERTKSGAFMLRTVNEPPVALKEMLSGFGFAMPNDAHPDETDVLKLYIVVNASISWGSPL